MPKNKLKVICVGGGIAGCAVTGILLSQGHEVHLYERNKEMRSQGAGLTLPIELVEKLLKENLITELTTLEISHRKFIGLNVSDPTHGKIIWEQPVKGKSLHWIELFKQLKKQIPDENYHTDCTIVNLHTDEDKASITLSNGKTLNADLIICADGSFSTCRSKIYPDLKKEYAGYIAWRGIASKPHYLSHSSENNNECLYYYGTQDGHLIAYNIMDGNEKKLNWVLYQQWNIKDLSEILLDKNGILHKNSLLPGTLSQSAKNRLHQHAIHSLPNKIAQFICETPEPFFQIIYSLKMPSNLHKRCCFLGDAGDVFYPHIGGASGAAIEGALRLTTILFQDKPIDSCLKEWNDQQKIRSENLHKLSRAMGMNLVLNPPSWPTMDSAKMSAWWDNIIAGKTWYFTESSKIPNLFSNIPSLNSKENASLNQKSSKIIRAKL